MTEKANKDKPAIYALLAGLATFLPLPWIDGYIERRLTGVLHQESAAARSIVLDPQAAFALTEDKSSLILGCLWVVVVWPLKKLFRSVFFVLAVKDSFDVATRVLHRVRLVEHALDRGKMTGVSTQLADARAVRVQMDRALKTVPHSPIMRVIRGARPGPLPEGSPVEKLSRVLQDLGGAAELDAAFAEPPKQIEG